MSQVTEKPTKKEEQQTRLYKRGNDSIDLDAYIRQAEAGFDEWLNRIDIKDKYKKEVRDAYRDLITRLNDDPESLTPKLGGGFTNSFNRTNAPKGFDAYGVAAGYLGKTLRGMSIYTRPETTSTKPKYTRNGKLIDQADQNEILGDNADNFIMLDNDSYDESTGTRGLTNRYAHTITGLEKYRDNLRDKRDFDSEDDYNHAVDRVNQVIKILKNGNPNDDWFALGQLGMTNLNKFFSTGKELRTTPLTTQEQAALDQDNSIRNFESWMNSSHPFYTGRLDQRTLGSQVGRANPQQITEMTNRLSSLNNDQILNMIYDYIEDPSYDFTHHDNILRLYGGYPRAGMFTSNQIMNGVFAQAIRNGLGKKISDTLYYFPDTLETHPDNSSTVYVYDTQNNMLGQVDAQDIEEYRNDYFTEYQTANPQSVNYTGDSRYKQRYPSMYPSHKEGGILKAQQGKKFDNLMNALTYTSEDLTDDKRLRNIYSNGSFTWENRTNNATDNIHPGNNQYDPELGGEELEQQDYYKNWLNILTNDSKVAEAYARRYRSLQPTTNVHYRPWFNNDDSFNFEQFKTSLVNNKRVYDDKVNGIGHDFYRGRVYQIIDENNNPVEGYYNEKLDGYDLVGKPILDENSNLAWIYQMKKKPEGSTDSEGTDSGAKGSSQNPEEGKKNVPKGNNSSLEEESVGYQEDGLPKQSVWSELAPELLSVGRLAGSIQTNNKIARIVRQSLKPKLHDTYELYSPVTGAFSEMQLRNRQAADVHRQANMPYTSDASLNTARSLDATRQANDLQYQGFIADDKEINRTQAEALKRQEDNIARRSVLANENRDAILANNQAVAQLEASRRKQNWNSIDNYLQGLEVRTRQRLEDDKNRREQFALQVGMDEADQWRRSAMQQLRDQYRKWDPEGKKTYTDWITQNQESYQAALERIQAVTAAKMRQAYADTYHLKYDYPTYTDSYGIVQPLNFNINSYEWKKNGGTLKPSSSYLIDKIIRNNEDNS